MQSGLIGQEQLRHKYRHEIHANEIVLLAYYIAAINIEATYHSIVGGDYTPFEGILLTDTFQMYEKDDLVDALLVDNSARRKRQKALDIQVIVGNPPYAEGQDSATDTKSVDYPALDNKIMSTYGAASSAKTRTNIYNSYIRAIRWASDRINDCGVVGFCTSASYLTATATDGVRKCLAEEFSDLYVFNLRGDARTSGELRRKEKDNVFGIGTREPIAVSVLVKNPKAKERGRIFYRDIGDHLSQAEKLKIVEEFVSVAGISESNGWLRITPDKHGDWLKQRDDSFEDFILIGSKGSDGETQAIFNLYSDGAITNRDGWIYNASRSKLTENVKSMMRFFNEERIRYTSSGTVQEPARFVIDDETKIKWDDKLLGHIKRDRKLNFKKECLVPVLYRPFSKQWMYFDKNCIWSAYQMPRIFPAGASHKNIAICTSGVGAKKEFFAIMVDSIIDRGMNSAGKVFPLHSIEDGDRADDGDLQDLFTGSKVAVLDAITDAGIKHFTSIYVDEKIRKEDVFYYIYGLFHSQDYRTQYADNLSKELPRIPRVKTASDFWAFSQAGRALADLHLN